MHNNTPATRPIEVIAKRLIGPGNIFVPMRLESGCQVEGLEGEAEVNGVKVRLGRCAGGVKPSTGGDGR